MTNDPIFENTKIIMQLESTILKLSNEKKLKKRTSISTLRNDSEF